MEKLAALLIAVIILLVFGLIALGFAIAKFGLIAIMFGLAIIGALTLLKLIF